MWYDLETKVVLVTGGSRGIGLKLAEQLIAQKAQVAICGRKQEGLDNALSQLEDRDKVLAVQAHIAREEDVSRLFEAVFERFGRLDILINNVGMNIMTPSITDAGSALWHKIIESNLTSTFLCSQKAANIMKEQGQGKIINLSSIAGRLAAPGMGIYGVAKAGVEMLTKVMAAELAYYNIQVNAVAPSMIKTDFSKPFWSDPDVHSEIVNTIPLGRIAEPEELANLVLFLCSSGADYITGQTIMFDGGSTIV